MYSKFYSENVKERDHFGDVGVDGKTIEMNMKESMCEGVVWLHASRDRDKWRALQNVIINLRVP